MQGSYFLGQRTLTGGCTNLQPSATFPLNRYVFELNNPGASNAQTGLCEINDFQITNSANFTREVGGIKLEAGYGVNALSDGVSVTNLFTQYLWRTLHLLGHIWFSKFENFQIGSPNPAFTGDTDILIEDGGHVDTTNPTPKQNLFNRVRVSRGPSNMHSWLRMQSGGYNIFRDCFVDGYQYDKAVVDMENTDVLTTTYNHFDNLQCLDLTGVPSPDNRKATVYMKGQVADNWFHACHLQGSSPSPPTMILLEGTGVVRNHIETDAFWGGTVKVVDTGTDGTNVVKVKGGSKFSPGVDVPITHTGGLSRIIDERRGAEKCGATSVSDGGTISHGLFTTPLWVTVTPSVASQLASVTAKTTTTFTVALKTLSGTPGTTQTVYWRAGVYA